MARPSPLSLEMASEPSSIKHTRDIERGRQTDEKGRRSENELIITLRDGGGGDDDDDKYRPREVYVALKWMTAKTVMNILTYSCE